MHQTAAELPVLTVGRLLILLVLGSVLAGASIALSPNAVVIGTAIVLVGIGLIWAAYRWPFKLLILMIWTSVAPTAYVFTAGSFGFSPYVLFEGFAVAGCTLRSLASKIRIVLPAGFGFLVLHMVLTSISALAATNPRVTGSLLVRLWLSWLVVFLLLAVVTDRPRLRALVAALLLQAVVVVGLSVVSSIQNIGLPSFPNFLSTQFQKNDYATYLSFAVALAIAVAAARQSGARSKILGIIVLALVGVGWPLTYSRSGLLAIAVTLVTFGYLDRTVRLFRSVAITGVLAALALAVLPSYVRETSMRAMQSLVGQDYNEPDAFVQTVDERLTINGAAMSAILEHPLLGIGLGEWMSYSPVQVKIWDVKRQEAVIVGANIHNRYLLIAAESGVAALVAYLAFVVSVLSAAIRIRNRTDQWLRLLLIALIASTVGLLASVLFIPGSLWEKNLFAVLAVAERVARREVANTTL